MIPLLGRVSSLLVDPRLQNGANEPCLVRIKWRWVIGFRVSLPCLQQSVHPNFILVADFLEAVAENCVNVSFAAFIKLPSNLFHSRIQYVEQWHDAVRRGTVHTLTIIKRACKLQINESEDEFKGMDIKNCGRLDGRVSGKTNELLTLTRRNSTASLETLGGIAFTNFTMCAILSCAG